MTKKEREQFNWKFQKIKNDPLFLEWLENQSNISGSLNTLVQFAIRFLGTDDIDNFDKQKKLSEVLLLQDEKFLSEIAIKMSHQLVVPKVMHSEEGNQKTVVSEKNSQTIEKEIKEENPKNHNAPEEVENIKSKYEGVNANSIFGNE
ncbi:hypothetical protein BK704_11725 [[Bacillus thuringiensis] serovar konkukian]|nr:hypothetical protein [Bacillus thuringiensis]MED1303820.1 hypothetical protein [Bacillus pacificus]OUB10732.1 hypothetical protein BK704_11725 [[Bacillus thuringiensis] serovar konkukian]